MRSNRQAGIGRMTVIIGLAVILLAGGVIGFVLFSGGQRSTNLNGGGATFPYPLYSKMISNYTATHPNLQINYQSQGSGFGINGLISKTLDFAGSDAPLSDSQRVQATNSLHIPATIGGITIAYNLPSISSGLNLTGPVVAQIYMGDITEWNDPAIANLNPGLTLPSQTIFVAHRSDGSGTTFQFTHWLSLESTQWNSSVGYGTAVAWPLGQGASGNAGVAAYVNTTEYAIGYVELAYALQNSMSVANIKNPSGNFIAPSLDSIQQAAAAKATSLPKGNESWFDVNLLDASDPESYPIASFSYILVYKELNVLPSMTQTKALVLVQFLWWMIHTGQNLAPSLLYVPLPSGVVSINEITIQTITFTGTTPRPLLGLTLPVSDLLVATVRRPAAH